MYIIAIAWLFVASMAAITEPNLTAGIITFLFWGVLPLSIVLYILTWPLRRKHRQKQEAAEWAAQQAAADAEDQPKI